MSFSCIHKDHTIIFINIVFVLGLLRNPDSSVIIKTYSQIPYDCIHKISFFMRYFQNSDSYIRIQLYSIISYPSYDFYVPWPICQYSMQILFKLYLDSSVSIQLRCCLLSLKKKSGFEMVWGYIKRCESFIVTLSLWQWHIFQ